ncbi:hypothetical protein AB5J52_48035 (plasmid) [Streptomyces sp. R39]|uniref:Uncharacterized protein n=1 Tax=Streptomyces sp. R39 TaxID=3238631 RepID=A0AB39R4X6_9ACTN
MDTNHPRWAREQAVPAVAHAAHIVAYLMAAAGPGKHRITTAAHSGSGGPVTARTLFEVADASLSADPDGITAVAKTLVIASLGTGGSILLTTTTPTGEETVRGWLIEGLAVRPLTAAQVHRAYHEASGPAPDVTFLTAFPVPPAS